jgi:type IV secretion system protein VirB5
MIKIVMMVTVGLLSLFSVPQAQAQWAVIDVHAIAQLAQEVKQMQAQYQQMQVEYQAMTGSRGMQNLLSVTNRNYLPTQWGQVSTALAGLIRANVNTNAVLSSQQVTALSPADREVLTTARANAALLQAASQEAYAVESNRFGSLQQLIDAIPSATDQKGALDLQSRIQAEVAMLQNEGTKLAVLHQAAQGEQWALGQRVLEQAVADIGSLRSLPPLRLP